MLKLDWVMGVWFFLPFYACWKCKSYSKNGLNSWDDILNFWRANNSLRSRIAWNGTIFRPVLRHIRSVNFNLSLFIRSQHFCDDNFFLYFFHFGVVPSNLIFIWRLWREQLVTRLDSRSAFIINIRKWIILVPHQEWMWADSNLVLLDSTHLMPMMDFVTKSRAIKSNCLNWYPSYKGNVYRIPIASVVRALSAFAT